MQEIRQRSRLVAQRLEHAVEIVGQRLPGRVALRRIARQRAGDDAVQLGRDVAANRRRRRDLHLDHVLQRLKFALPTKQLPPRQQLPEDGAQGEQIRATVGGQVLDPLGRAVGELPLEGAVTGPLDLGLTERLGDAEVEQLHPAGPQAHDVGRADVAVDDVERRTVRGGKRVRVRQRHRHFTHDESRHPHGARAPALAQPPEDLGDIAPADILHRQEVGPADVAEVEHLHDVRVVQERVDSRLLDEHVDEVRRLRPLGEDSFDDERPLEALHAGHHGAEHLRHPAHSDPIEKDVATEFLRLDLESFHRPLVCHRRGNVAD